MNGFIYMKIIFSKFSYETKTINITSIGDPLSFETDPRLNQDNPQPFLNDFCGWGQLLTFDLINKISFFINSKNLRRSEIREWFDRAPPAPGIWYACDMLHIIDDKVQTTDG